eukprot:CAMPEP_0174838670 /NCGR_PEP_ID=MMETSP1114-20130205/7539_1 /TAXON_ID=312471 /ORGANISM="Neobodo designis, Strain CCAP 1951/1" /LENGTH=311 /DNA_ID=CAMNT_0016072773 /DNA_START=51 /DNA_END=986 /DNA_ORIENTATION=+
MPVFQQAMASKKARKDRLAARRDDDDAGPVADEGEELLDMTDDDDEEEEEGPLADEADFSDEEDEEEEGDDDDDDDEVAIASGSDDGAEADEEEDEEAKAAVTVEFSEPKRWVQRMTLSATKPLPADLDPNDDPKREEVFMKHAELSVRRGLAMLEKAGVKWRRPDDYYAEMYKTDMHMERIRDSMEKSKKEVQERAHRRNMREQKKFGKEVQADVIRQRAQAKNAHMEKLAEWRKRKGNKGSLDDALDGETGDDAGLTLGSKKGRDKFRKPGAGGAARRGGAKRSLRPGAGAGKKSGKGGAKRPGKNKRR